MTADFALWGGVECTVNRVGDAFRDQLRLTGHHDRPADLAAFAAIGISKLRYPVLWERVAPHHPDEHDWSWSDARLAEIARLGMEPIVGLLHHGSGPAYTSLIAEDFPTRFADFAAAVARRYPHVMDWTPINEPLTTARFSALYGHWYPHARDDRSFLLALLNQIDGVRLAMRAIRAVNPRARLIQTEDLGQTYAAESLASVARYYNDRRWLTWDLLCGLVVPGHPMWRQLSDAGLADRAQAIADDPCPPDVIGMNYYVTSDRYLDADPGHGPLPESGFHDSPAARSLDPFGAGLPDLLRQTWQRYGLPIAMTECHLGCTRDEQMRWLVECWRACASARTAGIDVIALTSWALVGNVDWNSLLTERRGHFETGVFDPQGEGLRPTAQVALLAALQGGDGSRVGAETHPVLATPGWWRRPSRLGAGQLPDTIGGRPILISGASGTLGRAFAGACALRGLAYVLTDRTTMAIGDAAQVEGVLERVDPWAVVNATGYVRIDDAETDEAACHHANNVGAATLARACDARGIACLSFSSDQVFDGRAASAYDENSTPHPLNVYGVSKLAGERACLQFDRSLVVRTAAFFSPYDSHNFAMQVEHELSRGRTLQVSADHIVTPTYVPHLVNACLDLIIDAQAGLWHLTSGEAVSWRDFALRICRNMDLDPALLETSDASRLGWIAPRPRNAALTSGRGRMLPDLATAIEHHVSIRRQQSADPPEAGRSLAHEAGRSQRVFDDSADTARGDGRLVSGRPLFVPA